MLYPLSYGGDIASLPQQRVPRDAYRVIHRGFRPIHPL